MRREAEEAALRLEERRERLRRLLAEEREALAAELRERRRGRGDGLAGMRRRNEEERSRKVRGAAGPPGSYGRPGDRAGKAASLPWLCKLRLLG